MINLKKKLEALYTKKQELEKQILELEQQIQEQELISQKRNFSKDEKIDIFKSLFIARFDIYAKKWINKEGTKQNFFPVTQTFRGEDYLPLTNKEIEEHLRGQSFLATYCINLQNKSKFIAFEILDEDNLNYKLH
jgi:hypothetical protein